MAATSTVCCWSPAELGILVELVRPNGVAKGVGPEAAHPLMKGILLGLSAVHNKAKAIHRDIKSTNIVLTGEAAAPKVKIIDFGCAHYTVGYRFRVVSIAFL
jgi:serine/threonine protein kinase